MRFVVRFAATLATLVVAPVAAANIGAPEGRAAAPVSWAAPQIDAVVAAGLMGPDPRSFRPDDPLTRGELYNAFVALGRPRPAPTDPARPVTIRELNAQLVASLGALPAARSIRLAALEAGLEPTAMLGTETVARLLGLRVNHPQGSEELERKPSEPASRAEAAFSFARALTLDPLKVRTLVTRTSTFSFPALTDTQRVVLARALRLVGQPYVFGGTSERPQTLWAPGGSVLVPGGFDCSGFVWRVYKLEPIPEAPGLESVLRGRTTYQMSGEVALEQRIGAGDLQPADVVFFGSAGTRSLPSQVGHMGISTGNGWFVHSSRAGVTLQPLDGWYARTFAWARRPLAELATVPAV